MAEPRSRRSALIAAGSNLGDRAALLHSGLEAVNRLPGTAVEAVSALFCTPPWGLTDQPDFLNLVAAVETSLAPVEFLQALLHIETAHGRIRSEPWGPRTLDLDLLMVEGITLETTALTLPHPRWRERPFVVWPLRDLMAQNWPNRFRWKELDAEIQFLKTGPKPEIHRK